jgi:hypothetical protein
MKKFSELVVFHPLIMGENFTIVRQSISLMIKQSLIKNLNNDCKELLTSKQIPYNPDPNQYNPCERFDLLELLIVKALRLSSFRDQGGYVSTYNIEMYEINELSKFLQLIDRINQQWEEIASIKATVNKENVEIRFELL